MTDGYVNFGQQVAHSLMNQQTQYASRYIDGRMEGYPNLGEGLRFIVDDGNYHATLIHKDDIEEFVRRVKEYKENR